MLGQVRSRILEKLRKKVRLGQRPKIDKIEKKLGQVGGQKLEKLKKKLGQGRG